VEFGLQFFPDVGPETRSAEAYWGDALRLVDHADALGYRHVRTVEHYFDAYGGYSPNPHLFLAAAAQRCRRARLVSGAVVPAFNHPLKVAGEIGLLDALCGGRLECGFARAFLPHEFARFGVPVDESRARFDEGLEAVRRLLEHEEVTFGGRFHRFERVTSLPRPTQRPRPPFWVAAFATPESFERAGTAGHGVMAIPLAGGRMRELLDRYRAAWRAAGHPGRGRVMLAFHMFCHADHERAREIARGPFERYLASLVRAAGAWTEGATSRDYPGYAALVAALRDEDLDSQSAKGAVWVGSPAHLRHQIAGYQERVGGFEVASLQVNFNDLPYELALGSMTRFAREVLPQFAGAAAAAPARRGDGTEPGRE